MATITAKQQSFIDKAKREEALLKSHIEWKCETQGRCYNLEFQEDPYSPYDAIAYVGDKASFTIEVKVRERYTYKAIKSFGGSFLEAKKLKGILAKQEAEGNDTPILYINFFKDKVVTYRLPKDPSAYKWTTSNLQSNDYSQQAIDKRVAKLPESFIIEIKDRI